jgi:RNA polymerase sigma-70 factor (ECF subfamily)
MIMGMAASSELLAAVDRAVLGAEEAWPAFRAPRAAFRERVLAVLEAAGSEAAEALEDLHASDLYLAHACAIGVPAAIEAFTARFLAGPGSHIREHKDVGADAVRRELEDTLLLGKSESGPQIAKYEGRGPLGAFVKRAAQFAAGTLRRRAAAQREVEWVDELASVICSPPESAKRVVVSQYSAVIQEAVLAALWTLERRQRTVVRLHLTQGVSLTQIGKMFNVTQPTVSRWLQAAVDHLYAEIRRAIREAHGVEGSELESIVRDVRSQIDLSLSRILRDTRAPSSSS